MTVTLLFQREKWSARKVLPHTIRSLAMARSRARWPPVLSQTASSTSRTMGCFAIAWRGVKAGSNWRDIQVTSAFQEQVSAAARAAAVAAIHKGRRAKRRGNIFPQGRGYSSHLDAKVVERADVLANAGPGAGHHDPAGVGCYAHGWGSDGSVSVHRARACWVMLGAK